MTTFTQTVEVDGKETEKTYNLTKKNLNELIKTNTSLKDFSRIVRTPENTGRVAEIVSRYLKVKNISQKGLLEEIMTQNFTGYKEVYVRVFLSTGGSKKDLNEKLRATANALGL